MLHRLKQKVKDTNLGLTRYADCNGQLKVCYGPTQTVTLAQDIWLHKVTGEFISISRVGHTVMAGKVPASAGVSWWLSDSGGELCPQAQQWLIRDELCCFCTAWREIKVDRRGALWLTNRILIEFCGWRSNKRSSQPVLWILRYEV